MTFEMTDGVGNGVVRDRRKKKSMKRYKDVDTEGWQDYDCISSIDTLIRVSWGVEGFHVFLLSRLALSLSLAVRFYGRPNVSGAVAWLCPRGGCNGVIDSLPLLFAFL